MIWKKSKLVTIIHQSGDYTITEDANGNDKPFRLDSIDADPEWFPTLDAAKRMATAQNELALFKAENERLREELSLARQGAAFERQAKSSVPESISYSPHVNPAEVPDADEAAADAAWLAGDDGPESPDPFCGPDGRGVPRLQSA